MPLRLVGLIVTLALMLLATLWFMRRSDAPPTPTTDQVGTPPRDVATNPRAAEQC